MKKETLTSRERVIRAIEHKPVDRMPIDLGAHFSTGISIFAYYNLRKYLGLDYDNVEVIDMTQLLARVETDIIERFHIDTMLLNPPFKSVKKWNPYGEYTFNIAANADFRQDEEGGWYVHGAPIPTRMPKGGYFFDGSWIDYYGLDEDDYIDLFSKSAERIYKETDYFTIFMGFSGYVHSLDFACLMLTDPEQAYEYNKQLFKSEIKKMEKVIKKMGKYIGAVELNSDLGGQFGLLYTPDSYREICKPFVKAFADFVHANSDIKIFLHSCGAIEPLIEDIIDCGIDVLNPVQISAYGMDPVKLKEKYGSRITFWGGGCDTQNVLSTGTVEDVKKNVKELINIFKPDSGFVFNPVHNIMGNVPPENIVAMYDTAYENAFY